MKTVKQLKFNETADNHGLQMPAYSQLAESFASVLDKAWGGFLSEERIEWIRSHLVVAAQHGCGAVRVDRRLSAGTDERGCKYVHEEFLIGYVLGDRYQMLADLVERHEAHEETLARCK